MKSKIALFAAVICLLHIVPRPSFAQTAGTGALTITVTDPSGALVPGATIRVANAATALSREEKAGTNGSYTFTLLPPGEYSVNISAQGFSPVDIPSVTVNVTETHTLTQQLTVGSQEQQVTVQTDVQAVHTENATLGDVVNNRAISELPLVTRNFTQIMTLSPGVNASVNNAAALGRGFVSIYANGQNDISNTYQVDGVLINNYGGGSADGSAFYGNIGTPSPDALQEFKVQTAQYDASYGRNTGAQVNLVTKSGTNDLHGSLFEFLRNDDLNANDFFRNRAGQPRGELRQNQFGGTIGGPIRKDKLFYFLSYQGTRQVNGVAAQGSSTINLPSQLTDNRSAAALGAAFCPANNSLLNTTTAAGGVQVACDGSNINPVALNLLNAKLPGGGYVIPSPQIILNPGTASAIGFSAFSIPATYNEDQGIGNLDWVISSKHTLAAKAQYSYSPQVVAFSAGGPPGGGNIALTGSQLEALKLTSVLSARLVNEARVSLFYSRASQNSTDPVLPSAVGLSPIDPSFNVMPVISINGLLSFGGGSTDGSHSPQTTWEWADQLSWTNGKHTIRAGYEGEHFFWPIVVRGLSRGTLTFQTFSDFLLGESAAQNGSPTGQSNIFSVSGTQEQPGGTLNLITANTMSGFVQDDYKWSPKLTINLGLRWEYDGTGFDQSTLTGGNNPSWALDNTVPIPPAAGTLVGNTVAANYSGPLPTGVVRRPLNLLTNGHAPLTNFAPRLGFAWQPLGAGKFVVRGGGGIFYNTVHGETYLQELNHNPPVAATIRHSGATAAQATFADPYAPRTTLGWDNALRTPTSALSQVILDPELKTPESFHYDLNLEYAFTPTLVLEAGYLGTRSEHIITGSILDVPQIASPANPVNCGAPSGCITTNTSANAAQRVPVLGIAPNGVTYGSNVGDSDYNALQVTLRKNFSHGLTFQAAYTFGKTMGDVSGTNFVGGLAGSVNSNDPTNRAQQHGEADYDRQQRVVLNYSYQLPGYAQGQGALGRALTGWGISGVTVVQSGQPLTLTDSLGGGILGFPGTPRAQVCPGYTYAQVASTGGLESRLNQYFNLAAVADTSVTKSLASCAYPISGPGGPTLFGNSGRGILFGPGQVNFDTAITKNFRIRERQNLQFRTEFFNAFNHPQFSNPSTAVTTTGAFGAITSTSVAPRIMQFALRYAF